LPVVIEEGCVVADVSDFTAKLFEVHTPCSAHMHFELGVEIVDLLAFYLLVEPTFDYCFVMLVAEATMSPRQILRLEGFALCPANTDTDGSILFPPLEPRSFEVQFDLGPTIQYWRWLRLPVIAARLIWWFD
jgi:hypothetical protein